MLYWSMDLIDGDYLRPDIGNSTLWSGDISSLPDPSESQSSHHGKITNDTTEIRSFCDSSKCVILKIFSERISLLAKKSNIIYV